MGLQKPYTKKEIQEGLASCPFKVGDLVSFKRGHELAGWKGMVTRIKMSSVNRGRVLIAVNTFGQFENFGYSEELEKVE